MALARCHQRMTNLVVRYDTLLIHGNSGILPLISGNDNLYALLQVCLSHIGPALTDCTQRALVDDVGKLRAAGTGGCASNGVKVNVAAHFYILRMNLQNSHTALQIRKLYRNPAIKTARAKQCLIQGFRTVGRCQDDNALAAIKTIHLG